MGVALGLLQTHFSYWWMGDGCVRWQISSVTEEKQEHCFFLFYTSWFCWSSNFTFQIVVLSVDTKVYCTVMGNILFITNKGQDGLLNTKRYTDQSHLPIIAIVTGYFMQTQLHCCCTWYFYLLCLEFYILYSPLHKENYRFAYEDNKNWYLAFDNFDTCIFPRV